MITLPRIALGKWALRQSNVFCQISRRMITQKLGCRFSCEAKSLVVIALDQMTACRGAVNRCEKRLPAVEFRTVFLRFEWTTGYSEGNIEMEDGKVQSSALFCGKVAQLTRSFQRSSHDCPKKSY